MEDPKTWGRAEHVVRAAMDEWDRGRMEMRCGLSIYRQITDALRAEGLLIKEDLRRGTR